MSTPAPTGRVLQGAEVTGRGGSLNPFIVIERATEFIAFVTEVFGAREVPAARTAMPDGLLIHAEVEIGDSLLLLADRLAGWPRQPGLFQLWVSDVAAITDAAVARGADVVTPATPFYGEVTMGRLVDPWGNLWWLYAPAPGQPDPKPAWEGGSDVVFRTIDEHLRARRSGG